MGRCFIVVEYVVMVNPGKTRRKETKCPLCVSLSFRGWGDLSMSSCWHGVAPSGLDESGSTGVGGDTKVGGAVLGWVRAAGDRNPGLPSIGGIGPSISNINSRAGPGTRIGRSGHGDRGTGLSELGQIGHLSGSNVGE